jgi:ribosomal protein S27E
MADQTLIEADFLQDLQEFVRQKWSNNPCNRCGNWSWSPLPGDAAILRLKAETPANNHRLFTRNDAIFIPIYCDNCGNTVVIYSGIFDEWRRRRNQAT